MVVSFSLSGLQSMAETTEKNYDSQIQEAEKEKARAKSRATELAKDLEELERAKDDILKYVKKVDKKVEKVSATLEKLDKKIEKAKTELVTLEEEVTIAENIQNDQYEKMKKRIKYMYENGGSGYVDAVFGAKSITDLLNRSEYVEKISEYDTNLFVEYTTTKAKTEQRRMEVEEKVWEIAGLQEEANADKEALKKMKKSKKQELLRLKKSISNTDAKVRTFNAQVAKQEQAINNLLLAKQREINRKAAAQKAAAKANGSGNSSNEPASYSVNASGLRWPLNIPGRISSRFGAREQPTAGASTNHQGLDIAAAEGTPIVAAGDGTVVTATYSSSAGNYLMLYHGNSLYTVYMHCSKLAVSEGATVKAGDTIAYVGSTGVSTGAHLHFGISINGVYVNPENYVTP
nr:peptidoglycan DD-metalloendopeptidase family protein [Eubacterium sp.]